MIKRRKKMSNYICREDAVDVFNRAVQDVGILDADDIKTVFEMLSSADVAPVVRCKDCLFFTTEKSCCRPEGLIKAREDAFCSYGERREEEDNG
jgi:hypothetical protein